MDKIGETVTINFEKMTPEKKQQLEQHIQSIAKILYEEAEPEDLETLEGIEETVRRKTLDYITPQIGFFLSKKQQEQKQVE